MAGWIFSGMVGLVLLWTQIGATAEPTNRSLGYFGGGVLLASIFALASREQKRKEHGENESATAGRPKKSR